MQPRAVPLLHLFLTEPYGQGMEKQCSSFAFCSLQLIGGRSPKAPLVAGLRFGTSHQQVYDEVSNGKNQPGFEGDIAESLKLDLAAFSASQFAEEPVRRHFSVALIAVHGPSIGSGECSSLDRPCALPRGC